MYDDVIKEPEGFDPCPFHKEEILPRIYIGFDKAMFSGGWCAEVECPECDGVNQSTTEELTREDAIETLRKLWNTRYEENCSILDVRDYRDGRRHFILSCGHIKRGMRGDHFLYCEQCGKRVRGMKDGRPSDTRHRAD